MFAIRCAFCSSKDTKVIETRETGEEITRRRRECLSCHKRFTTYERFESINLRVIKKDGNRVLFDKNKIRAGILKACEKRPISSELITQIVDDIEKLLITKYAPDVKSSVIGNIIIKKLKKLDTVAYIRFASVYKEFKNMDDFKKIVNDL